MASNNLNTALNRNDIAGVKNALKVASVEDKNEALLSACEDGKTDMVVLLLDNGADINCKSVFDKFTPLHEAAGHGHVDTVRLLLDQGADRTIRDNVGGYTALGYAKYMYVNRENVDFNAILALYKEIPPPAGAKNDGSNNYGKRDPVTDDGLDSDDDDDDDDDYNDDDDDNDDKTE